MTGRAAGYRLSIVNPLTLVGGELKSILHDRGLPHQRISLLTSLEEEAGALTEGVDEEAAFVQRISELELEGEDLVFFCGSAEGNRPWIERSGELGFIAVDLSQPAASDGIPVVAGINTTEVPSLDTVVISPHPVATPLILLLAPLRKRVPVELCAVTVIQPASEYGQKGIDELLAQTINVLNVHGFPTEVFPRQLAFNLYPATEGSRDEEYAASQIRSVAGSDLPISLAIVQGTTFHSHTFSIFLRLGEDLGERDLADLLSRSGGVEVAPADETYSTVDASGRDEILVGRVRRDPALERAYWVWLVSDNLRRASALNSVLVAEDLLARFKPLR
jgi:aspartate-semialdehyde dehydrogenase